MEDDPLDFQLNSQFFVPVINGDFLSYRKKVPFSVGRQMGIISHSVDPNHGYVQWMGLGYPLDIPYYFAAGQGNKFNLKPDDEIEFDLVPDFRGRFPRFEATQIEPLEAGSLRYEFSDNLVDRAGLDRETGVIFKMADVDSPGIIQWQPFDTCFYPSFQLSDVLEIQKRTERAHRLNIGDRVKFYHARERNKDVEQKLAKFIVPARCRRFQGEVCSIKSGYGFIKRLDVDKETFFHASQVATTSGDTEGNKRIEVGDKIDFSLGQHDGKEVALQIVVLPRSFPIIFDDQTVDPFTGNLIEFKGRVVRPCVKGKLDQPGLIKYKNFVDNFEVEEIEYYERDRQNSFTILQNDKVLFHIVTDRRSHRERAVNIRIKEDEIMDERERGMVAAVKDGFGFIKRDKSSRRDHHDSRMFFHSSELLDKFAISGRRRIKMGDEVEFTVLRDPLAKHTQQGRYHATRIKIISSRNIRYENHNREKGLNYGSKWIRGKKYSNMERVGELPQLEVIELEPKSDDHSVSLRDDAEGVIQTLPTKDKCGFIRLEKHMGSGEGPNEAILCTMESFENVKVLPQEGSTVHFDIEKRGGEIHAMNIQSTKRYSGKVKLIKENENYGFVVCDNENEDLFFHFSDATNFDKLRKDDRVDFCIRDNDRSGKRNAYDVSILERKKLVNRRGSNCLRSPKPGFHDQRGFTDR